MMTCLIFKKKQNVALPLQEQNKYKHSNIKTTANLSPKKHSNRVIYDLEMNFTLFNI